jgi:hypothetical protein
MKIIATLTMATMFYLCAPASVRADEDQPSNYYGKTKSALAQIANEVKGKAKDVKDDLCADEPEACRDAKKAAKATGRGLKRAGKWLSGAIKSIGIPVNVRIGR